MAATVVRRVFEAPLKLRDVVAIALELRGGQHVVIDSELSSWDARAALRIALARGEGTRIALVERIDLPPRPRAASPRPSTT